MRFMNRFKPLRYLHSHPPHTCVLQQACTLLHGIQTHHKTLREVAWVDVTNEEQSFCRHPSVVRLPYTTQANHPACAKPGTKRAFGQPAHVDSALTGGGGPGGREQRDNKLNRRAPTTYLCCHTCCSIVATYMHTALNMIRVRECGSEGRRQQLAAATNTACLLVRAQFAQVLCLVLINADSGMPTRLRAPVHPCTPHFVKHLLTPWCCQIGTKPRPLF